MKKSRIDIQLLLIILIISLVVLVVFSEKKTFNWDENYEFNSKEPYNLYVLSEILRDYFPENNFKVIKKILPGELPTDSTKKGLYVFIGKNFNVRENEITNLLNFVSIGNEAFISCETLPDTFLYYFPSDYNTSEANGPNFSFIQYQDIVTNFEHKDLEEKLSYKFTYYKKNRAVYKNWYFINMGRFNPKAYIPLSYYESSAAKYTNFIKIPYNKGFVFIHTTPVLFTNFFIKESEGLDYCSSVFSNFKKADIYMDSGEYFEDKSQHAESNLLTVILSYKPLLWAWYIMLSSTLIFLLVFIKRKQRIIPVINPLINTSISFVEHIGKLYYLHDSVKNISNLKMKLFLFYVRNKFKIDASKTNDNIFHSISIRSGINVDEIKDIFNLYNDIQLNPDKDKLKKFHKAIINFYKKTK